MGSGVGLALVLAPGAKAPRWIVGAVLLIQAALALTALRLLDGSTLGAPQASNPWAMWFYDFQAVLHLGWVAVFIVIPGPLRLRSPRGILVIVVGSAALLGTLLWFFGRPLLWLAWPGGRFGDQITLLGRMTFVQGLYLGVLALIIAALHETRDRSVDERRTLALLLVGLFAFTFQGMGRNAYEMAADLWSTSDAFATPSYLRGTRGDPYQISVKFYAVTLALAAGASVWIWRVTGSLAALALGAVGVVHVMLARVSPFGWGFLEADIVFMAILVMVAVQRHQVFGPLHIPATASRLLALVAAASVFLVVNAYTIAFDNTLILAGGMFVGAILGAGAALAMLPRGRSLVPQSTLGSDAHRGLAAYKSALQAELGAGLRGAALMEKLRPLRTELDLSDRDHAILEHAMHGGGGGGSADAELRSGDILLGRYHIERLVGKGGGSQVYLARDERLGRRVALKRLSADQRRDRAALERFQKETRLASALQHASIVIVHDIEIVGNEAYLVMEYVPGGSVEERLRLAPMNEADVRRIALDTLAALAALHGQGIVHRDVKPSNILLTSEGRAKLSDFSVARAVVSGDTVGFTGSGGAPVGTPAYMAPEQARGLPATAQSDIYSLGATLYAALTGAAPIVVDGLSEFEARLRVASEAPALPLRGTTSAMNAVLARALARDASDRYVSAAEMLHDLTG